MKFIAPDAPPPLARWTSRVAFFSLALLGAAVFMHRLFATPTPVAVNLVGTAFIGAALALLLAIGAAVQIWRTGKPGTPRVLVGSLLGVGLLTWPLYYLPQFESLPALYDVSTDTASPPAFVALAKQRGKARLDYPRRFAAGQAEAYPDLRPLIVDRGAEEAFELTSDALRRLKIAIVREEPPTAQNGKGSIEAVDRTLVFGFYDDIAVRVQGDTRSARIDLRSASRWGRHDLGRNAERLRQILKEIVARLEATVPTASGERVGSLLRRKRLLKRHKAADQKSAAPTAQPGAAQPGAQRAPAQKATPPSKDGGRGRGRRSGQSFE